MTAARNTGSDRWVPLTLLATGALLVAVGLLALLGWVLHIPLLTTWRTGTLPIAPITAALAVLFGAAVSLSGLTPPRRGALIVATLLAWVGLTSAVVLLAFGVTGVSSPAQLLGVHVAGSVYDFPVGYITPTAAFCFLLANSTLLLLLAPGLRGTWRGWVARRSSALLMVVGLIAFIVNLSGAIAFRGAFAPPAINTCLILIVMGLALLVFATDAVGESGLSPESGYRGSFIYVSIFAASAASITLAAYAYYLKEDRQVRGEVVAQLEVISALTASELGQWRKERLGDAAILSQNTALFPSIDQLVQRLVQRPDDAASAERVRGWLRGYRVYGQYDRATLMDARGAVVVSEPGIEEPTADKILLRVAEALRTGQPELVDFYEDERDHKHRMATIIPVFGGTDTGRPTAVLVLRIDPDRFLHPLTETRPGRGATTETLLVRGDGSDALMLNDSRFDPDAALHRRIPLSQTDVLSVKAVLGHTGVTDGVDYRGARVLGVIRAISDSPWYLITQIQVAEIAGELWREFWLVAGFGILLLSGVGSVLGMAWRHQRARFYKQQADLSIALKEGEERLRLALSAAEQGLWDLNVTTGDAVVSPEYATMLGYEPAEFHETNAAWIARLHPDEREAIAAQYRDYVAGRLPVYHMEFRQRTKSGDWKWILSQGKLVSRTAEGQPRRMIGTHTDITTRKRAELRSQRLTQLYAALGQCNQAIVQSKNTDELFPQVCRAAVASGGMAMAWVGLVDEASHQVAPVAADGKGGEYLEGIRISVDAHDPFGRGPTGAAIRENRPVWCEDFAHDPTTEPWHERGKPFGWAASGSLPLVQGGRPIGALTIYAFAGDAFDDDARTLLMEAANDISFALDGFERDARRKEMEAELRESELRYRTLFAESNVPRLVIDPATDRIVDANQAAGVFYGWTVPVLLQMKVTDINTLSPEEIHDAMGLVRTGRRQHFGESHRLASGEVRDVEVFSASITLHGQPLLLSAVFDVTERKQATELIQSQLEELQRWQDAMLGREDRVQQLKREVNELGRQAGEGPRYPSQQPDAPADGESPRPRS